MGGPATLVLDAPSARTDEATAILTQAQRTLQRIEARYSRYVPDSLVSQINAAAGSHSPVALDQEAAALFGLAASMWQQSEGLFDVTAGGLRSVWDFEQGRIGDVARLDQCLSLVGWDKVCFTGESIALPEPGMQVDLGGLVKEYAADTVIAALSAAGFSSALVELAGDVAALGCQGNGSPWRVGIRDPSQPESSLFTLLLDNAALASSGGYMRKIHYQGRLYSHFLNPRTGWPLEAPVSVSVLAEQCLIAGAVSTIAALKPAAEATSWLQHAGLPWLLVDADATTRGPLSGALLG